MKINIWNFEKIEKTTRRQLGELRAENKNANLGLQCRCVIILSTINSLKSIYFKNRKELYAGKEAYIYDQRQDFPSMIILKSAEAGLISTRQAYDAIKDDPNKLSALIELAKLAREDQPLLEIIFDDALDRWKSAPVTSRSSTRLETILENLYKADKDYPTNLRQKILDRINSKSTEQELSIRELTLLAKYTENPIRENTLGVIRAKATSSTPAGAKGLLNVWDKNTGWSLVNILKKNSDRRETSVNISIYTEAICSLYSLANSKQKEDIISEAITSFSLIDELRYRFAILKSIPELPVNLFQNTITEYLHKEEYRVSREDQTYANHVKPNLLKLDQNQIKQILNALIKRKHLRSELLIDVTPLLNREQVKQAAGLVEKNNEFYKIRYWTAAADKLREEEICEIFNTILSMNRNNFKASALGDLAPYLSSKQLDQTIEILETFGDPGDKYNLIAGIAQFLNEEQFNKLIEIAHDIQGTVYDDWYGYYSMTFRILAKHAPAHQKEELLKKAIDYTYIYNLEQRRNLFRPLIEEADGHNIDQLLFQISRLSDHLCHRSQMLNLLAPRLDREQLSRAIDIVNWGEDGANLSFLFSELACYTSAPEKEKLLYDAVTFAIHEEFGQYRESAISELAPLLDEKQSLYAMDLCNKFIYRDNRNKILSSLNENLFLDPGEKIRASIKNISRFHERMNYLAKICNDTYPNIPPVVFEYLPEDLNKFTEISHFPDPIVNLAPYLEPEALYEIIEILLPKVTELGAPFEVIFKLAPLMSQEQAISTLDAVRGKDGYNKDDAISLLTIMQTRYPDRENIIIAALREYRREQQIAQKLREEDSEGSKAELHKIHDRNARRLHFFKALNIKDTINLAKKWDFLAAIFYLFTSTKERREIISALLGEAKNTDPAEYPFHTLNQMVPYMDISQREKAIPIAMTSPDSAKRIELLAALGVDQNENSSAVSDEDFEKQFCEDKTLVPISYRISKLKSTLQQYNGDKKSGAVSDLIEDLSKTTRGEAVGTISALVPTIFEQEGTEGINEILSVIREIVEVPNYDEYLDL